MSSSRVLDSTSKYNVDERAPHTLHECRDVAQFCSAFQATTGCFVKHVADDIISPEIPRAVFLVGSIPLGMATSGSDLDLLVLVDDREVLLNLEKPITNTDQQLDFRNDTDSLLAGMFLRMKAGILLDIQVAITSSIRHVQQRLRRRGPDLSESEMRTLGRLGTGWLLWQSESYLERNKVVLNDPALTVYSCTKNFVSSMVHWRKAVQALDLEDFVLTLHMARSSVELAYLSYFASEGLAYLGAKWPAQLGYARGGPERLERYPLLRQGANLLFPTYELTTAAAAQYVHDVKEFLSSMQRLIEQKTLFRIAFHACPQIYPE